MFVAKSENSYLPRPIKDTKFVGHALYVLQNLTADPEHVDTALYYLTALTSKGFVLYLHFLRYVVLTHFSTLFQQY